MNRHFSYEYSLLSKMSSMFSLLFFAEKSDILTFMQGIEIRYSAHSAFTFTSLLIFKNLSKIVLLRTKCHVGKKSKM